ncbi:MAG TPA: septation protein IspZ [Reyranella sp.]|nr:septation protein IspZ [Reyranella sp.]
MKNLFEAARVLLYDLASTIFFLVLFRLTGDLIVSVAIGMAIGAAQISWQLLRGKPVEALQWVSVALVVASGTATLLTNDPRFVMLKPTAIYAIVGIVMLKRGWMNRYMPPRAAPVLDVATTFGYVWAGLMFFSAALNLALAFTLDATDWAAAMSIWGIASKLTLFLVQYAVMMRIGRRRAAGATPLEGAAPLST